MVNETASTRWRVELHCHTHYSRDCLTRFKQLVDRCRRLSIDKIAITDHNTAEGALALAQLEPGLVIVAEEIMTTEGELLGYFMKETIPPGLSPQETIQRLRAQGAFISVSHPFDRLRKGAWTRVQLDRIIHEVDAIEVFNARCLWKDDNEQAQSYAAEYQKPGTVGSDAHIPFEIGKATLQLPIFEDVAGFAAALTYAQAETRLSPAWVHGFSSIAKWQRKYAKRAIPLRSGNSL